MEKNGIIQSGDTGLSSHRHFWLKKKKGKKELLFKCKLAHTFEQKLVTTHSYEFSENELLRPGSTD